MSPVKYELGCCIPKDDSVAGEDTRPESLLSAVAVALSWFRDREARAKRLCDINALCSSVVCTCLPASL
jgi:hypothetical protein